MFQFCYHSRAWKTFIFFHASDGFDEGILARGKHIITDVVGLKISDLAVRVWCKVDLVGTVLSPKCYWLPFYE